MTLPNTFLVGAPKAGTTSLACWLDSHPQVHLSVPKEPYYWASDYPGMRRHYGFEDRSRYEALYEGASDELSPCRLDASTTYLYSETAVPDILHNIPGARFIVAVRNPADLLISYHRTQLITLNEDEHDFARAWRRSLAGRGPATNPLDAKLLDYPKVGAMGAALAQLLTQVSSDRVHVVLFDELAHKPEEVWDELVRFLNLDPTRRPDFAAHNASTKTFRSPALRRLTHRPPKLLQTAMTRLRQWSRTTALPSVAMAKRHMWRNEDRPTLDRGLRADIGEYFCEDIQLLEQLTARDLTAWLPDRVKESAGAVVAASARTPVSHGPL